MFRVAFQQDPRVAAWQMRLAKLPRWGWWLIAIAVITPVVLILAGIIALALIFGFAAIAVVICVMLVMSLLVSIRVFWLRLRNKLRDDGRRNVRIVVRRNESTTNYNW